MYIAIREGWAGPSDMLAGAWTLPDGLQVRTRPATVFYRRFWCTFISDASDQRDREFSSAPQVSLQAPDARTTLSQTCRTAPGELSFGKKSDAAINDNTTPVFPRRWSHANFNAHLCRAASYTKLWGYDGGPDDAPI